ncbi:MAG TPA: roadblock/LC7 domain-containing protein [Anaerolineae bacterium]|nr:roadblock/LC7 domain-containing protein [Anaerolineae bacterium]HMR65594.1 roadblock/LC7 domain-containing protein [Anaerolineae bacterium]
MTANNLLTKDNNQLLKEALHTLITRNPNIISAQVVSDDGLNVASSIPYSDDDDIALITSNLIDTAQEFSQRLEQGGLTRILLEGERRTTIVMKAGKRTVLVVCVTADEKLGLVTQAMRHTAERIIEIFG